MVSVKQLTFSFKKGGAVLSDLDLELGAGRIYGLLGLNGAGKTTLLHNITGALFPDSGSVQLPGGDPRARSPQVLKDLYIVPEQFELPSMSGEQFNSINAGFYPDFSHDLMQDILSEFELDPKAKLTSLSFGQQKKFMIAFAVATQTKVLLLDEPTNGLDIPSKSQFRRLMASLDIESRCIIISTHQVRDLGSMIDHILILKEGMIVFDQPMDRVIDELQIQQLDHDASRDYLYGEESLTGMRAIVSSSTEKDTQLDLELLFNGIIQNTSAFTKTFNGGRE